MPSRARIAAAAYDGRRNIIHNGAMARIETLEARVTALES